MLCELPTIQFSPPLGEVTVMVGVGAEPKPRQPLIKAGVKALVPVGSINSKTVVGGQKVVSTGTYLVESQPAPVLKYNLATTPFPAVNPVPNQIPNICNLCLSF